ncbi:unnamed protein product, partial [Rotaria sp. Silwood2]
MLKQLNVEHIRPRPIEAAAVYNIIAAIYYSSSEDLDEVENNLKIALEIEQEHQLTNHVFVCETFRIFGAFHDRRNNWAKALDYYDKTLRMAQNLARPNNPLDLARIAAAYNNIGIIYDLTHRYERAKYFYHLALKSYDQAFNAGGKDYHHASAETLNNLACVYDTEGDYETSQKFQKKILDIYKNTLGDKHLNVGKAYVNYGITLYCLGKFRDALHQCDKALNIYTSLPLRPNQSIATVWSNAGESYRTLGETAHAIEYLAKGFHLRLSVHKNNATKNLDVATSYKILADFYMSQEELCLADIYARHALNIFQNSEGSDRDIDIASTYNILGEIARRRGELRASIRLHEAAFKIFSCILSQNHVMVADCFYNAAKTHLDQKNYSRAILYCVYAKYIYKKRTPNHSNLSEILSLMGRIYEAQVDYRHSNEYDRHRKEYDRQALQHAIACGDNANPLLVATYYDRQGENYYRTKQYVEAFNSWGTARELRLRLIRIRKERRTSNLDFYLDLHKS